MTTQNLLFFDKKGEQYNFEWNGNFWEGSVLFPIVSEKLFEIEHIFVIEKFLDNVGDTKYGFPHSYGISPGNPVWRTKWESDYDEKIDVSSTIFTYELGIDTTLDAPYLVKAANVEFYPEVVSGDTISSPSGIVVTSDITSSSMQINVALNSDTEGVYDRTLILEDYTDPNNPVTILRVNFHGEVEGEDSRLSVLLDNFGRSFVESDSFIVRDTDIKEPLPNYEIINQKRKELLLTGESIFPYLGSYKSLFNAIKFFGYYDLRIKEYWLNVKVDSADVLTPLQQNSKILTQLAKPNLEGQNSLELISSLLKDENEGKFKHVEIYGKRKDGTFGLKKQFEEVFPSKSYKKTSLFGLFYDINRVVEDQDEDQYGYPVVEDAFMFSPEEVLLKLFGLKERLKRDYLPLNARIVDITGEGVYFNIYKTRGWVDQLGIDEVKTGIKVDFTVFPNDGYIEDLRVFYTKQNQSGLLYPAINGTEPGISYYGNTIEPYSYFQKYPVPNIPLLTDAIQKFYNDIENGTMPKFLGDGDYDPPGYQLYETGQEYVFPAGCPVIIKDSTFDLSWDELSVIWQGLDPTITTDVFDVASYTSTVTSNPGTPYQSVNSSTSFTIDSTLPQTFNFNIGIGNTWFSTTSTEVIFVRIESQSSPGNLILGYSTSADYNSATGILTVQIISKRGSGTYSDWKVTPTNISTDTYEFTYFMNYVHSGGFYSWDRLPYLDFYEIEWTIYKNDDMPYYFQIRGGLPELETLPHFLPYTGEYNVQCRVWDTLNSISLGIKRSVIKVDKRQIELNTIARYRESEKYDWENMPLKWESYPSQWIWPVENTDKTFNISDFIQNFPEYSNNFNEGQTCEVLSKVPEVKATTTFDLSASSVAISTIQSVPVGGGYSFAVVTTTTPHGFSSGDTVWINDIPTSGTPYGQFPITVLSSTTFEIPQIVITAISGGNVYGPGTIKVIADGVEISSSNFQGNLNSTVGVVYNNINSSTITPKYKVISLVDSVTPGSKTFVIQAPNNKGASWNGKSLTIQTTGCLSATPTSTVFSGGVNESQQYLPYDFNTPPNPIMKYWGTKKLCWDTFEDFEFAKAYAHTWDMYDYHNDWLGGFDLYSLQYGDRVRVTKDSLGVVFTEIDSPGNGYLDLKEAADQLNDSTDDNIKRFNYTVRGFSELPNNFYPNQNIISPDLSTTSGPKNVSAKFIKTNPGVSSTGVAWDGNGDIWMSGTDLMKFDGLNWTVYDNTNSVMPGSGLSTNCVLVDNNDNVWVGLYSSLTPLVFISQKDSSLSKVYDVIDFVDNSGNPVIDNTITSINDIQVNSNNGDIFLSYISNASPGISGLLYYSGTEKSWRSFTPQNSNLTSGLINDIRLENYKLNKWYLWIGTNNGGLFRFDGIDFINYTTSNSGLPSNKVYSIEIDKLGHKWIGGDYSLSYWDGIRWMCWNSTTNPEISDIAGFLEIKDAGNSNIWFVAKGSTVASSLYSFDGYVFNQWIYGNDGSGPIEPNQNSFGNNLLIAPWKVEKNGLTIFPKNVIFGDANNQDLCIVDYVIPHIHATSTDPGTNGWDFVYHDTAQPLPSVEYIYNSEIGTAQIGFNFIPGPLNDNITLGPYTRPVMAHVDRNSWYKPIWQRYPIDYIKSQFPSLNIDDVFLYAPLRDILNGKATRESYWRNSIIERIAKKKQRDLFQNFEWIISLGNSNPEMGVKITVDNEGNNIVIGNFEGLLFMGAVNNLSTQDVYINSVTPSVFVAKYNKGGVLQWATTTSESPSVPETASSVVTDVYGNIYVVVNDSGNSYFKFLKYNPLGDLITTGTISSTSYLEIFDIKIDKYESIYIGGRFIGDFSLTPITLSNTGGNKVGFIAKMDSSLSGVWSKSLGDGTNLSSVTSLGILKDEYLYCTGLFETLADFGNGIQINGLGTPDSFISKIEINAGTSIWAKSLAENSLTTFTNSTITIDPKGNLLIAGSFDGTIKLEEKTLSSFPGTTDIFVIKLTPTGKLTWMKMCGGSAGDYAYDVKSDSDEDVFVIGSFTGTAYFSPDEENSRGGKDIYLVKFNKEGLLVDIVTAGGTLDDEGLSLVLDPEENIYITGYFEGNSDFSPYIVASPPGGNNMNAFIGKIPKERFQEGLSIGSVQSWLGSHSWSWREERFYDEEFEIPLATTIFINPIDSLIPGKKNHVWTLTDTETEEVVAKIRKTPYFIWTFTNPGFYSISCSLQDANGNLYETQHKGKIRVIDHKTAFAGDLIPDIVNPEDYLIRSIYYDRKELGFPPLNPFEVTD